MSVQAVLAAFLLVSLAGCMGGTPSSTQSTTRTQECPAWQIGLDSFVKGLSRYDSRVPQSMDTNDTFPVAASSLVDQGRALDKVYIFLQPTGNGTGQETRGITATDARLTLSFFRADTHEPLLAYDMSKGAPGSTNLGAFHWTFGPTDGQPERMLLLVRLTQPPLKPDPNHPTPITVEYTYETNLDKDNNTPSLASIDYVAKFEYRVC